MFNKLSLSNKIMLLTGVKIENRKLQTSKPIKYNRISNDGGNIWILQVMKKRKNQITQYFLITIGLVIIYVSVGQHKKYISSNIYFVLYHNNRRYFICYLDLQFFLEKYLSSIQSNYKIVRC